MPKLAFHVDVPDRFGPHRVVLEDPGGRSVTQANVTIEVVDGKPEFVWPLTIGLDDVPFSPDELATVDWHKAAWDAVHQQAFVQTFTDPSLSADEAVGRMQSVDRAAEESRRYNRLTAEQLTEVLGLWETGGAMAVANRFCVSRRQADRYVRKAREVAKL